MIDEIKPHIYCPDYQAQGDCRVCGHGPDAPWHKTVFATLCPVPEARRNADDMGLPPSVDPAGVLREDGT